MVWLFIQFTMAGVFTGSTANAMQLELCSAYGIETITIDPATGEPIEPTAQNEDCDWCRSFSLIVDTADRGAVAWQVLARADGQARMAAPLLPCPVPFVADNQSRAPPLL